MVDVRRKRTPPGCHCFQGANKHFRQEGVDELALKVVKEFQRQLDKYEICEVAAAYAAGHVLLGIASTVSLGKGGRANTRDMTRDQLTTHMLGISMVLDEVGDVARDTLEEGTTKLLEEKK